MLLVSVSQAIANCADAGSVDGQKLILIQMDVDVNSRRASAAVGEGQRKEEEEVVGPNGKIRITGGDGENFGFCRPGDEDCG